MSRVLVVGTKDRLKDTIEILYKLENVHVVDFPAELEGFTLGSPLPEASDASHKLLKLRSMEKDLDIDPRTVKDALPVRDIETGLDRSISEVEAEIAGVIGSRNVKLAKLSEIDGRLKEVEPYGSIPLDLGLYRGYQNLAVLAGTVRGDPEAALGRALKGYELFYSGSDDLAVVFVDSHEAEEARRVLAQYGFAEVPLPTGEGRPQEVAAKLRTEKAVLETELAESAKHLESIRRERARFVVSSDEHLSIVVEKAEAPLRFGATDHSFVIDAWVPSAELAKVREALSARLGDGIYVELLEQKGRSEHHETSAEEKEEAGILAPQAEDVPEAAEAPTRMTHTRTVGLFTFYTKLISTPRYNEIDPTITIALFFPIFFGLMVGDVGYGIPFTVLGYLGLRRAKSQDWRAIATMLFFGGLASIVFGVFLYGDMFGIVFHAHHPGEMDWSTLMGVDLPAVGIWNKIDDIKIILWVTVWIGIFHLLLGTVLGFYNVKLRHGLKHAVMDKFSWLMIISGAAFLLWKIAPALIYPEENPLSFTDPLMVAGIALLVAGLLMALKAEGGRAIIEMPELLSNILSYTRIAAIGMSKAGMALAFNFIALEMIAPGGGIMLVLGLLVFIVGHLMIFILAIISAGLHAIRLQYVELFQKFFEGGGQEFSPLRIKRKHTILEE